LGSNQGAELTVSASPIEAHGVSVKTISKRLHLTTVPTFLFSSIADLFV
jgi:hypothetical protein